MLFRILKYVLLFVTALLIIALLILFVPPIFRNLVTYPKLDKEVRKLQQLRKETDKLTDLNLYRGVIHVHSYWSHDSEGTLADILPAARENDIDFVFLSDHPHGNRDTLPRGYDGYFDGILMEAGSEKQGFITWPLDSLVIDWSIDKDSIARDISSIGGILFYSHTEEPHNWDNKWYHGMEIYNFHADTKDESLVPVISNFIINGKKYPMWSLREVFDEQIHILSLWDSLNTRRKIVGFSAVDTHENQNLRARYLKDGRVEWVGPNANVIDTTEVNFLNRWLLHEPDSSGWIFKWMIDTYRYGFNYITNYVFADTLTVESIAEHLKKGHIYTAFRSLGDAGGFLYYCTGENDSIMAILGDSIRFDKVKALKAVSPLPGRFRLVHDGKIVNMSASDTYEYTWEELIERGAYRIEINVSINDKAVPWLYSNPIYIY